MASEEDHTRSPFGPLLVELARMKRSNLSAVIDDVDGIIDLLTNARDQIEADDSDTHRSGTIMATLQSPIKSQLEAINSHLKEVTKARKSFGKALDKALPQRDLPMETDAMKDQGALINRAIAMHLLREGYFSVASTFLNEVQAERDQENPDSTAMMVENGDEEMVEMDEAEGEDGTASSSRPEEIDLHAKFADMYYIIRRLKQRDLDFAIQWAHGNDEALEAKGSNLEFELCKLKFVWLFKGPEVNGLPDDEFNGKMGALRYVRQKFARFQSRHLKEIQQLSCAMLYAPNLEQSPYRSLFEISSAFEDVAASFTREFCSLLGLSASSPLYVAVTAGSIALPRLIKYTAYMKENRTEWTTENELAFETPLPNSMIYHSIFVCPVSKEQTTAHNPPMMLTCGHVLCRDSLHRIAKGSRYKCPYCPTQGQVRDALRIWL